MCVGNTQILFVVNSDVESTSMDLKVLKILAKHQSIDAKYWINQLCKKLLKFIFMHKYIVATMYYNINYAIMLTTIFSL